MLAEGTKRTSAYMSVKVPPRSILKRNLPDMRGGQGSAQTEGVR